MSDLAAVYMAQAQDPGRSEHWSGPAEMVDRLARFAPPGPGALVVDVGCGLGGPARRLASRTGCRVLAVDLLPQVLGRASARPGPGRGRVRFAAAAAHRLPVRDGAADQVWALGVVAHLPDVPAFAAEAARVLRPGGPLLVTEGFWAGPRPPRFERSAPAPWHPLTAAGLAGLLRGAGLDGVSVEPWPGGAARLPGAGDRPPAPAVGAPNPAVPDPAGSDPALLDLAADLADGRIVPALVVGWRR